MQALTNTALTLVLLLTAEGFSSIALVARAALFGRLLEERKHTQSDEEIGWINLPSPYVENMYGPGKSFRTNSMRLLRILDVECECIAPVPGVACFHPDGQPPPSWPSEPPVLSRSCWSGLGFGADAKLLDLSGRAVRDDTPDGTMMVIVGR